MKKIKKYFSAISVLFIAAFTISIYCFFIIKSNDLNKVPKSEIIVDIDVINVDVFDENQQCKTILHYSATDLHPQEEKWSHPSSISGEKNYKERCLTLNFDDLSSQFEAFFGEGRNTFYNNAFLDYQGRAIPNNQITQVSKIYERKVSIGTSKLFKHYYIRVSFDNPAAKQTRTSIEEALEKEAYVLFKTLKGAKEAKEILIKNIPEETLEDSSAGYNRDGGYNTDCLGG